MKIRRNMTLSVGLVGGLMSFMLGIASLQAQEPTLRLHYTFDEATSGNTDALSTGSLTAGKYNGEFNADATRTTDTPGDRGGAALDMTVNGNTDNRVETPEALTPGLDNITEQTITWWMKVTETNGLNNSRIVSRIRDQVAVMGTDPSDLTLRIFVNTDASRSVDADATIDASNKWVFCSAYIYYPSNPDSVSVFVGDETTRASKLGTAPWQVTGSNGADSDTSSWALAIGNYLTHGTFKPVFPGYLDDVRFYEGRLKDVYQVEAARLGGLTDGRVTTIPDSVEGRVYDTDGDGDGDETGAGVYVRVRDTTGTDNDYVERVIVFFPLPDLLDGEVLDSATFNYHRYNAVQGDPVDIDLYHLQDENDNSYELDDFNQAATLVTSSFVDKGGPVEKWFDADATAAVRSDYANDPAGSRYACFRLQLTDETNDNDSENDGYYFSGSGEFTGYLTLVTRRPPQGTVISVR
ncbi:MAG: hypothetical protein JXB13_06400 [Phycisphaerae bacterium]|nr:hypothetical protein [Phycisphaerae bacterium]